MSLKVLQLSPRNLVCVREYYGHPDRTRPFPTPLTVTSWEPDVPPSETGGSRLESYLRSPGETWTRPTVGRRTGIAPGTPTQAGSPSAPDLGYD